MKINLGDIYRQSAAKLAGLYDVPENESVAMLLVEHMLQVSRRQIMLGDTVETDADAIRKLEAGIARSLDHVPVQHIMKQAHFYGRDFSVSPDVLIPRPETEELVHLVLQAYKNRPIEVLDIGTGSGCIAITLALEHKAAEVTAVDVSPDALKMARSNAARLGAKVAFCQMDVLKEGLQQNALDVIVSNPPYIPDRERKEMEARVVRYEPGVALFVPDHDPLLFYRRLGALGRTHLKQGGGLFVEIHESYGREVVDLYLSQAYEEVECLNDMQGKPRMVRAVNP
ncbi:MAG: peptide chain release factor N(5)-glutamine methyltransferase [Cyclobacteriaceae bacterium]